MGLVGGRAGTDRQRPGYKGRVGCGEGVRKRGREGKGRSKHARVEAAVYRLERTYARSLALRGDTAACRRRIGVGQVLCSGGIVFALLVLLIFFYYYFVDFFLLEKRDTFFLLIRERVETFEHVKDEQNRTHAPCAPCTSRWCLLRLLVSTFRF